VIWMSSQTSYANDPVVRLHKDPVVILADLASCHYSKTRWNGSKTTTFRLYQNTLIHQTAHNFIGGVISRALVSVAFWGIGYPIPRPYFQADTWYRYQYFVCRYRIPDTDTFIQVSIPLPIPILKISHIGEHWNY
jgi:hypothetical protein